MPNKQLKKFLEKLELNSYYPPLGLNKFMFYDPKIAEEIKKEGTEMTNKLTNFDEVVTDLKKEFESVEIRYDRLIVNGKNITGGVRLYKDMPIFCKTDEVAKLIIDEIKIQLR